MAGPTPWLRRGVSRGLSQVAFAQAYGLPARSVANRESTGSSSRTAPQYVVDLLAYAVIAGGE